MNRHIFLAQPRLKLWKQENANVFLQNFNSSELPRINQVIDGLAKNSNISTNDVDEVIHDIEHLFHSACADTFGTYTPMNIHQKKKKNNKPWFNAEYRESRNFYHKTRRLYNKHKTDYYKNMLKTVSKSYKNVLSKNIRRYKNATIEKIRKLKSNDPKEYWWIINAGKRKDANNVSIDDFFKYFESINNPSASSDDEIFEVNENETENDEINMPISESEIRRAAKELKRNKSPGCDQILNEHIQVTLDIMLPTYVNLFNLVLDNAVIPESWLVDEILPIYKNKGDTKNPENYRPIKLLSCVGKLFTSIVNSRLNKYAEEHNVISDSQTGFRKGFSTADNLYVINSLTEILKSNSKKNILRIYRF